MEYLPHSFRTLGSSKHGLDQIINIQRIAYAGSPIDQSHPPVSKRSNGIDAPRRKRAIDNRRPQNSDRCPILLYVSRGNSLASDLAVTVHITGILPWRVFLSSPWFGAIAIDRNAAHVYHSVDTVG